MLALLGSCWYKGIKFTLLLALVLFFFKLGYMFVWNIADIGVVSDYSFGQYFRNVYHMDSQAVFVVGERPLSCYREASDALEGNSSHFLQLDKGDEFVYKGYQLVDTVTVVSIEIGYEDSIHCYLRLPMKWTGRSYWKNGSSELIVEKVDSQE